MRLILNLALGMILSVVTFASQSANVLIILSDSDHLDLKDGNVFRTGFYLNELMQPVKRLMDAGHTITFATPNGLAPALDKSSNDKMYFNGDEESLKIHRSLLDKLQLTSSKTSPVISLARVEQIGYDHFDALYIPGGHAPMQDLLTSKAVGKVLKTFHEGNKPTALVCHGPIALLATLHNPEIFTQQLADAGHASSQPGWIYSGYRMTVISNKEEEIAKSLLNGGVMKFYPQTALEQAGGKLSSNTEPFTSHVVTDRELITGQNPASAADVADELLSRLK
ncbi:type 1 glutamine amidotransferase domain-containing protein [Leclercia pneumoniae]|uniref:type 1 glutamine amidotransferase domain-containing protein n=1 Tax=Leclercia pneumoniae TaxID=2815358 RepID=UPI003AF5182F